MESGNGIQPADDGGGAPDRFRRALRDLDPRRVDSALGIAMYVLGVLVLVIVGAFAWTVYSDWSSERQATPASRALEQLKDQVRAKPNDANLRVRYGESLAAAGLLREAVDQLNQALKVNPEHTGALVDLGIISMQETEYRSAEAYFQKVVDLTGGQEYAGIDERRELALFYLGEIALTEKRFEDAVPFFKGALRIRKDAADTYLELALAYRGMGRDDLAREQLEIAVAFDPGLAQAQYELGDVYLDEGDELKAAEHFGRAYALAPENQQAADAVDALGPVERRMAEARKALDSGATDKALEEARFAHLLDRESFEATVLYAQALEASGDPAAALAAFKDADKMQPGDTDVAAAIARLSGK